MKVQLEQIEIFNKFIVDNNILELRYFGHFVLNLQINDEKEIKFKIEDVSYRIHRNTRVSGMKRYSLYTV